MHLTVADMLQEDVYSIASISSVTSGIRELKIKGQEMSEPDSHFRLFVKSKKVGFPARTMKEYGRSRGMYSCNRSSQRHVSGRFTHWESVPR